MKARRLTPHRSAVLETIRASRTHPTAAEIYSQVRRRRPGVAYATIYNALDWLTRNGMVSELRLGDEASRYDLEMSSRYPNRRLRSIASPRTTTPRGFRPREESEFEEGESAGTAALQAMACSVLH